MLKQYDDRAPILNPMTGEYVGISSVEKGSARGSQVCAFCYGTTKDPIKSAVYVKGGTEKTVKHFSHYPKCACSGGQTSAHSAMVAAIAHVTSGVKEATYKGTNFKSDVKAGNVYWEVVYTSGMTEEKRHALNPMVEAGEIKIKIVKIKKIPREMMNQLWDIYFKSPDDWQYQWFDLINVNPFTIDYWPRYRTYVNRAAALEPIGDSCVGHFGNKCCTGCEHAYVEGSSDLFHCHRADAYYGKKMVVTNGSTCEFNLGLKQILETNHHDN